MGVGDTLLNEYVPLISYRPLADGTERVLYLESPDSVLPSNNIDTDSVDA